MSAASSSSRNSSESSKSSLRIQGGRSLSGTIVPSGNKNAVLPILSATLLTDDPVVIRNVPFITDVVKILEFFRCLGSDVNWDKETQVLQICHRTSKAEDLSLECFHLVTGIRSALLLLAPLLHRFGKALSVEHAQGCSLGIREIDPHLEVLQAFGASIEKLHPLTLLAAHPLRGVKHWADYASVTATEQFVMAAVLAKGRSVLINAASEPHVQDLCVFLQNLGAHIEGIGTSTITIEGVDRLHGGEGVVSPDHHEIVTFLAIGAITGGEVRVKNTIPHHFPLIDRAFEKLGAQVHHEDGESWIQPVPELVVKKPFTSHTHPKIEAAPWPYFPVDLMPPMIALATKSRGSIMFWNKVYEGAFGWLTELQKFGAHVVLCDPHRSLVFGDNLMYPAVVETPYIIRVAIALYMVASSIPGESVVRKADPIRRAHPNFVENLTKLGAEVEWCD